MNGQGIDLRPVFTPLFSVCHKTQTHLVPVPSRVPTPRQLIPRITRGIGFLGYPTPLRHTVGDLLRQRRRATGGYSVPCTHFA
jgi:hypothetical protein